MLTKKLGSKTKEEQETIEINKKFAERVNEIEKINKILNKIAEKGYSEKILISVVIKDAQSVFSTEEKKFKDYEECIKYLNNIFTKTIENQIKYYKNPETELIRYIYGRQFILLNNFLKNISPKSLAPFLKYLTNDIIESSVNLEEITYKYDNNLNNDSYLCLLENINKFLNEFLDETGISLENIYQQNIIKEEYKNEFIGLYTYLLEDDKIGEIQKGIEEHILNWYYFLTDHSPMAQTILLCNEETTSEEITAFMYRAFLCQHHVVFMIGKIELLTSEKAQTLTGIINNLFIGHEKEMKSCLVFAYSDKNSTIVEYVERIKGRRKLEHNDKKKNTEIIYDKNVEIVYSDRSGVGKSTYIKEKAIKEKKKYIHFPFGGEFSRKDVSNRLNKMKIKNKENEITVIHLDLYDSKQIDLMKDFLYSFLITKLYGQSENLFYLSKDVEIKIEIPNGFVDFFLKFPLLNMFAQKHEMKINNLPELIVPQEINSNMQIVCNYLKLLKNGKLADHDLFIKNISIDLEDDILEKSTKIDAESLSAEECQSLIKEYLDIKNPTYYQINSFVKALSGQLKKFSMNYLLTAANLIENQTILEENKIVGVNSNLQEIRVKMIKGFIENTKHFTQGAFNKLLDSQDNTYKVGVEQGKYDENKQNNFAIEALSSNEEIISFEKIKPSLVFFHEGEGQEFSIISSCAPNEQEYKDLRILKNLPMILEQIRIGEDISQLEELKNYTNFEHKSFLKEIKEILNLDNPIDDLDKKDDSKNLKTIEEIVGEYVFTADNFIKMVLILIRIRENIPIIMMGETGCGKTSLIRKLSELINNGESKMKILNIHAGITDQEIVDFLFNKKIEAEKSIVEEAEDLQKKEEKIKKERENKNIKYFEKKLWIFLDEINTCNSMGLICELMTKHSCQGVELPKSIVFIGACNPYRFIVKDEEPNGLKIPGTEERKLVYTVNPLPHSLLNFVFNFGNLTKEDEKRYIQNMIVRPIESYYWQKINKNEEEEDNKNGENNYNIKEENNKDNEIKKEENNKELNNLSKYFIYIKLFLYS